MRTTCSGRVLASVGTDGEIGGQSVDCVGSGVVEGMDHFAPLAGSCRANEGGEPSNVPEAKH